MGSILDQICYTELKNNTIYVVQHIKGGQLHQMAFQRNRYAWKKNMNKSKKPYQ